MKSPQGISKRRRGYSQLSKERRLNIAQYMVDNPNVPVKQVAFNFGVGNMVVYRIIYDLLDIRKQYAFKQPTEPTE